MAKRGAVVIGVDRTGQLTPLKAAAVCARRVETWLLNEGYDVICLTDDGSDTVTIKDVKKAIRSFVTVPATYHQLVVYFTGHGHDDGYADYWLLSDAPDDPDEAVNLERAKHLARRCGVENVAFISDACRSLPNNAAASKITGSPAFPIITSIPGYSDIDYFKATGEATSAWEGVIDGDDWSVLTKAWMQAYKTPSHDMILQTQVQGSQVDVVPNRRLKSYLEKEVNRLLFKLKLFSTPQEIDVSVASEDHVYIATYQPPPPPPTSGGSSPPTSGGTEALETVLAGGNVSNGLAAMSSSSDASNSIMRAMSYRGSAPDPSSSPYFVYRLDTEFGVSARLPSPVVSNFETHCGFTVTGTQVLGASSPNVAIDPPELRSKEDGVTALRVHQSDASAQVLIKFEDGRGTVMPALRGYIGHIVVNETGVVQISYVPAEYDHRYGAYHEKAAQLDRLRALAALSSEAKAFRLASKANASELFEDISYGTSVDPSLSLYAAYSLTEINAMDMFRTLYRAVREDLGVYLFDHQILGDFEETPVASQCPMLTRSWNLLGLGPATIDPVFEEVRDHLQPCLWTTFSARGMEILTSQFQPL